MGSLNIALRRTDGRDATKMLPWPRTANRKSNRKYFKNILKNNNLLNVVAFWNQIKMSLKTFLIKLFLKNNQINEINLKIFFII